MELHRYNRSRRSKKSFRAWTETLSGAFAACFASTCFLAVFLVFQQAATVVLPGHAQKPIRTPIVERERETVTKTVHALVDAFMREIVPAETHCKDLEYAFNNDPALHAAAVLVRFQRGQLFIDARANTSTWSRYPSLKCTLVQLARARSMPDTCFIVILNDGFEPSVPAFGSARHWPAWTTLIPAPIGNTRGMNEGFGTSLCDWDAYVEKTMAQARGLFPWDDKEERAVFRGSFTPTKQVVGMCDGRGRCKWPRRWTEMNRGRLHDVTKERQDLFDVRFTAIAKRWEKTLARDGVHPATKILLPFQQKYKYILNVGSNQDWAERLQLLLFMDSVVLRHEAQTQEWFYPLLRAYVHYVPFDVRMADLARQVEWARENDEMVSAIPARANELANKYLRQEVMLEYWSYAIRKFADLQSKTSEY